MTRHVYRVVSHFIREPVAVSLDLCVCVCVSMCAGAESHLVEVADWPEEELQLGQVAGLALNSDENLVIFHRGEHTWGIKYVLQIQFYCTRF